MVSGSSLGFCSLHQFMLTVAESHQFFKTISMEIFTRSDDLYDLTFGQSVLRHEWDQNLHTLAFPVTEEVGGHGRILKDGSLGRSPARPGAFAQTAAQQTGQMP